MSAALASKGLSRPPDQTPLEFAEATALPEVLAITKAYNRVRFGARALTGAEAEEVERQLLTLERQQIIRDE